MTPQGIADTLRHDMLTGALPPGTRLHQAAIATRFAVSRIPARDALALLSAQGLVDQLPNRGARVLSLSPDEIDEIFDLRVLLETDCLARAIPATAPADLDRLRLALKRSDLDASGPDWAAGDAMFHQTLYAPSDRPRQIALIDRLRQHCQMHIAAYHSLPHETPRWLADHAALVDLTATGQTRTAIQRLTRHLRDAQMSLQQAMTA